MTTEPIWFAEASYPSRPEEPKGDAINVLDWVADVVERAFGFNDKWTAIWRLDWELAEDPMITVKVGYKEVH